MSRGIASAQDERSSATLLFCRSDADGSSGPNWDDSRESELRGQFEVGLTVGDRYFLGSTLGSGSVAFPLR